MIRHLFFLLVLVTSCRALGQVPYTPQPGSSERKAILDAIRPQIEKVLKKKVLFKVTHMKVLYGWAFTHGIVLQPNGKPFDFKGTPHYEEWKDGVFSDSYCGLVRKFGKKWKAKIALVGMSDVPWVDWDKEYKAPRAVFDLR